MNDKLLCNLFVNILQKPIMVTLYLYLTGMSTVRLEKIGKFCHLFTKYQNIAESPLFTRNADRAYNTKNKDYQRR